MLQDLHVSAEEVLENRERKHTKRTKTQVPLMPSMLQVHRDPASTHPKKTSDAEKMKGKQRVPKVMKHLASTVLGA